MITYTPVEYADNVYGGAVTCKTIRNWIKAGKKMKGVDHVETTPTNHYIIFMKTDETDSEVESLMKLLESKAV